MDIVGVQRPVARVPVDPTVVLLNEGDQHRLHVCLGFRLGEIKGYHAEEGMVLIKTDLFGAPLVDLRQQTNVKIANK